MQELEMWGIHIMKGNEFKKRVVIFMLDDYATEEKRMNWHVAFDPDTGKYNYTDLDMALSMMPGFHAVVVDPESFKVLAFMINFKKFILEGTAKLKTYARYDNNTKKVVFNVQKLKKRYNDIEYNLRKEI